MVNSKNTSLCGLLSILLWLLSACQPIEPAPPHLVVEGWINADGHPVVMLHRTYPINTNDTTYHSMEDIMKDHLIMFGKVTISDGDESVVLTGRPAMDYMLPYIYTSVFMTGKEGHTYTLTAEYDGLYATATTTIPKKVTFDSICITAVGTDKYSIVGHFNAPANAHYIIFTKYTHQQQYILCPLGAVTTPNTAGHATINIFNPNTSENTFDNLYWTHNDTTALNIRVAHIDEHSWYFWDSFASNCISTGLFYLPIRQNIESNINGGIGYWSGMGSTEYTILLNHAQTYHFP